MQNVTAIVGWALYILLVAYVVADLVNIAKAVWRQKTIRVVDIKVAVVLAIAVAVLIVFGVTGWRKLHLLWVIPAGFLFQFVASHVLWHCFVWRPQMKKKLGEEARKRWETGHTVCQPDPSPHCSPGLSRARPVVS